MKDRRAKERRNLVAKTAHTTQGKKGRIFDADRRRIPDRRLNNIRVEFISIEDFYNTSAHTLYHS